MGKSVTECKGLGDLVRLFGALERLQKRLLAVVQGKIDAMKRADVPRMRALSAEEQDVVKRLQEREGFRRQLMDQIGVELGLPARSARALPVSQLAARVPVSQRADLIAAAERLRDVVSRVARVNRVASMVSKDILEHMKWVFASVRPQGDQPGNYAGNGATVAATGTRIFETVG